MIEALDVPLVLELEWDTITLTHFSYSFEFRLYDNYCRVNKTFGKLKNNGKFVPYFNQDLIQERKEYVLSKKAVDDLLAANDKGKKANQFRTDDIIKKVKDNETA